MSNDLYIMHYGVGHDKGGHSGRYPWGSGKNPKQDLGTLKRGIRKDIRKAKGKTSKLEGKHPAFMTETYASILADAGIFTTFGAARKKNRPAVKAAIERRYNNDPNFRAKVKEARKYWIDAGKKAEKNAQAYVKYYEKSEYTPKEVGKAKAYVDYIKNNIDKRVGNILQQTICLTIKYLKIEITLLVL